MTEVSVARQFIRDHVPPHVRSFLLAPHRRLAFSRAMAELVRNPGSCSEPDNLILSELLYGWGNGSWVASSEFLAACVAHTLRSAGPILECGSGLSTVTVGAVANLRGVEYYSLEHSVAWSTKVQRSVRKYALDSVTLHTCPLRDYGEFAWYDVPAYDLPRDFALVICDGPPATTKGGRYGLGPVMRNRLISGAVILLDDADRRQESDAAKRWCEELGGTLEIFGSQRPYGRITLNRG